VRSEKVGHGESLHRAEHGFHVPMVQGLHDFKGLPNGKQPLAFEAEAKHLNRLGWQFGQVGQGAALDVAALSIALAQKHRRGRPAIGNRGDEHAYPYSTSYG
jgi:hypothetical protein